jgi:hypothetical protein
LNREAMLAYGKALSSLRVSLSDEKLAQQNGTIIAMLLLSRLEVSIRFIEPFSPQTDTSVRRLAAKSLLRQASIFALASR